MAHIRRRPATALVLLVATLGALLLPLGDTPRVEGNLGTYVQRNLTGTGGNQVCHSQAAFVTSASAIIAHGSASTRLYICGFVITGRAITTTNNGKYVLVEGTGAVCGTGTAALIGSTVAVAGMGLPVGHASAMVAPQPWLSTQTAGNQVCLLVQGALGYVGVLTYGAY